MEKDLIRQYHNLAPRMAIYLLLTIMQLSIFFTIEEFENILALMSNQFGICDQLFWYLPDYFDQFWLYSNRRPGRIVILFRILIDIRVCEKEKFYQVPQLKYTNLVNITRSSKIIGKCNINTYWRLKRYTHWWVLSF